MSIGFGEPADVAALRWAWGRELAGSEARLRDDSEVVLSPTEASLPLSARCGFGGGHGLLLWRP